MKTPLTVYAHGLHHSQNNEQEVRTYAHQKQWLKFTIPEVCKNEPDNKGYCQWSDLDISELSEMMKVENEGGLTGAQDRSILMPAGFTYFGQFVSHDFSTRKLSGSPHEMGETPTLSLESMYGFQGDTTYFATEAQHFKGNQLTCLDISVEEQLALFKGVKLRIYKIPDNEERYDHVRNELDHAIIPDKRNDENFIVAQIHVALARFHNAMADYLYLTRHITGNELLELTRRNVILHYQWVIVHQYLKLLTIHEGIINRLMLDPSASKIFRLDQNPVLMDIFLLAAFRFGHSQVRATYRLVSSEINNPVQQRARPIFGANADRDLRGFRRRDALQFDWDRFFDGLSDNKADESNPIDPFVIQAMFSVVADNQNTIKSLPFLNLKASLGFQHCDTIAKEVYRNYEAFENSPISQVEVLEYFRERRPDLTESQLALLKLEKLPMWFYLLLEAAKRGKGAKLGLLGSHIVAEQFIWVLLHEPNSLLDPQNANWTPFFLPLTNRENEGGKKSQNTMEKFMQNASFNFEDVIKFPDHVKQFSNKTPLLYD